MEKIKVLIADDHRVVREGLAAILKTKEDIQVLGEAQDGMEAVEKARVAALILDAQPRGVDLSPGQHLQQRRAAVERRGGAVADLHVAEIGTRQQAQQYVMSEMQKPIDTPALVAAAKGQPALAAQIYAASLLAIEVDTPAEKKYLDQLETGLGLQPEVTQRIKDMVGLRS